VFLMKRDVESEMEVDVDWRGRKDCLGWAGGVGGGGKKKKKPLKKLKMV
jgi:hypothetical protein